MDPVGYEKYKRDKNRKTKWEELKSFLHWYEEEHGFPRDDGKPRRYCLALSIDDILTVMRKIEEDENKSKIMAKSCLKSGQNEQKSGQNT